MCCCPGGSQPCLLLFVGLCCADGRSCRCTAALEAFTIPAAVPHQATALSGPALRTRLPPRRAAAAYGQPHRQQLAQQYAYNPVVDDALMPPPARRARAASSLPAYSDHSIGSPEVSGMSVDSDLSRQRRAKKSGRKGGGGTKSRACVAPADLLHQAGCCCPAPAMLLPQGDARSNSPLPSPPNCASIIPRTWPLLPRLTLPPPRLTHLQRGAKHAAGGIDAASTQPAGGGRGRERRCRGARALGHRPLTLHPRKWRLRRRGGPQRLCGAPRVAAVAL